MRLRLKKILHQGQYTLISIIFLGTLNSLNACVMYKMQAFVQEKSAENILNVQVRYVYKLTNILQKANSYVIRLCYLNQTMTFRY